MEDMVGAGISAGVGHLKNMPLMNLIVKARERRAALIVTVNFTNTSYFSSVGRLFTAADACGLARGFIYKESDHTL